MRNRRGNRPRSRLIWRYLLIGVVSWVMVLTIAYFTPRQWRTSLEGSCDVTFYLSGDAIHTNLTLPLSSPRPSGRASISLLTKALDALEPESLAYEFLSVGWGDRGFYTTTPTLGDLRLATTLKALLWPTETVLHLQGHLTQPTSQGGYQVKPVRVSQANYQRLLAFIAKTFQPDPQGSPLYLQASYLSGGHFYAAIGWYSIFQTCNDWTAAALRAAHMNTPLWSGLASSLFRHLRSNCQPRSDDTVSR